MTVAVRRDPRTSHAFDWDPAKAPMCALPIRGHEGGEPTSWVECSFLLDPDMSPREIAVVRFLPGVRGSVGVPCGRHMFRFSDRASGTGALALVTESMGFELVRIDGVVFRSDGATVDKRLWSIDLRERFHTLDATFLGSSLAPEALRIVRIDDGAGHAMSAVTNEDGWVSVTVPREIETLQAKIDGYRKAPFHDLEHVRLEPE